MIHIISNPTMTRNEIKEFTLEEKECIAKKKSEIKEAGEAIRRNNGGKNPILGF